jgi:MHS family citrate/tricarballylate:H+ symporter-like MFS transporter
MTASSLDASDLARAMPHGLPVAKVFAVAIGNALEFYDFLTFSLFAVQIGHCFFPEAQTSHGLLFTLATFGAGFVTRPLGGIVIGTYGDRVGRKPAMMLSFMLMGIAIFGLVLTPSYGQIGIAAPILLLLFRLVQGFALGGEVGPSTAFLVEAAPPHRRGLYVAGASPSCSAPRSCL